MFLTQFTLASISAPLTLERPGIEAKTLTMETELLLLLLLCAVSTCWGQQGNASRLSSGV